MPTSKTAENRKSTRYIREDVKVSVIKPGILGLKETIKCKLIDISSTGIQISTPEKFGAAYNVTVKLEFDSGKIFNIKSRIVNKRVFNNYLSVHSFPQIKNLLHDKETSLERLCLYEADKQISAKFRNLGSSSVKILTPKPLDKKKQHCLIFTLSNEKKHKVWTQISEYKHQTINRYGIQFVKNNDELGDYMVEDMTTLIFQ